MGLRFRKSINLGGGVKLNISKKSVGISAGVKGARVSVNSKGRRTTSVGIPGTGLSYVSSSSIAKNKNKSSNSNTTYEEVELTEDLVLQKYKEWKAASNISFILSAICFIGMILFGPFFLLLFIACIILGVITKLISKFTKNEGFRQLNKK